MSMYGLLGQRNQICITSPAILVTPACNILFQNLAYKGEWGEIFHVQYMHTYKSDTYETLSVQLFPRSRKIVVLDRRCDYVQKQLQFYAEGTHIDVTTLQRNAYFFWKMQDLRSKTFGMFPPHIDVTTHIDVTSIARFWNPISSVVRFYNVATNASHLEPYQFSCSYSRVYAWALEPYQFSCSYIRVYAWVLEPYQFSCSCIRVYMHGFWNPINSVVRIDVYSFVLSNIVVGIFERIIFGTLSISCLYICM